MVLSASGASLSFIETMERAGPFGQGNPEPVFALPAHTLVFADAAGNANLRLRLKGTDGGMIDAIAFRALGQPLGDSLLAHRGKPIHVIGTLSVDRWGGREKLQLRVIDAAAVA